MQYTVLIPARLASTRLPNKPLADIGGIPMVVRVAQRVQSGVPQGTRVVVAADHTSIVQACARHGIESVVTAIDHVCGTDRLAQACELLGLQDEQVVVNVQGDEPLIDPQLVSAVAQLVWGVHAPSMGTAAHPIVSARDFVNPNIVKVVTDAKGFALYFSRAPIAWPRDLFARSEDALPVPAPLRHIGIYAYRVGFLRTFTALAPAPIETTEALEQLRALWHGHRIAVHLCEQAPEGGVDTPEDLVRVREIYAAQAGVL
jgi:3-deoxy-manno-octulosonate cytidylyltransferase (CMP-KDO synthetase)